MTRPGTTPVSVHLDFDTVVLTRAHADWSAAINADVNARLMITTHDPRIATTKTVERSCLHTSGFSWHKPIFGAAPDVTTANRQAYPRRCNTVNGARVAEVHSHGTLDDGPMTHAN